MLLPMTVARHMSGVKMVFTHDTDMTLMHAAALANTGPAPR